MSGPIDVFISYAREDGKLLEELRKHLSPLERQGYIRDWNDREIPAGADSRRVIDQHLERAEVILLLVSPDFLASDHLQDIEIARALARHAARKARVIPVLLRPCDWKTETLSRLQPLPRDERPISSWKDRDEAWTQVTQELRRVLEEMQVDPPAPPPSRRRSPGNGTPTDERGRPTWASVRRLLREVLRSDSAFDAFCLDYFEPAQRLFSDGMDRARKENTLFKETTAAVVLARLRAYAQKAMVEHEHLIEYEDTPGP